MDNDNSLVLRLALLKKTVTVLHGWVVVFFLFQLLGLQVSILQKNHQLFGSYFNQFSI